MERGNVVGNNIRAIRTLKGLTQESLALECGLSQGYINQLENGKRLYTQKSLEVIARALATPMENFFKEENNETDKDKNQKDDFDRKRHHRKELLSLLNGMPDHIVEHYITLVRLEKQILKELSPDSAKTQIEKCPQ